MESNTLTSKLPKVDKEGGDIAYYDALHQEDYQIHVYEVALRPGHSRAQSEDSLSQVAEELLWAEAG